MNRAFAGRTKATFLGDCGLTYKPDHGTSTLNSAFPDLPI